MIPYLLDTSLCWFIFYLLYYFWLSKETFFHLNRWYLLGTLFLGLIIPLVPSPFGAQVQESDWVTLYVAPINMGLESLQVTVTAPDVDGREFDWLSLLKWIYWGGVILTGFRFLSGLWRIGSMYRRAEHIRVGRYRIALTDEPHLPFSFFRVVFKSKLGKLDEFEEEKITVHELAHVRGWHTIDVLLVELVSIFLWCSPPVHLYRRSLRIVHEYIADSAAIRTGQKKKYGHLLIRQSQSGLQLALANHFIQSQLKKRITMMTRTRSRRQAFLKYLPVIPLLVVALVVFSNWDAVASDKARLLIDSAESFQTAKPLVADDYDPRVLRKQLTAVLYRRQQLENNQDAAIARNFASLHDEWAKKYPEHRAEIKSIAEKVAGEYDLAVQFNNHSVSGAYFKYPFESLKEAKAHTIKGGSDGGVKLQLNGEKDPYVLIDDEPAPENWKAGLKPDDIKSVEVLKGEKAVAAYGEKAKDGVIRIYTKGFKEGQTVMPRFPGCEDIENLKKREDCANANLREHLFANLKYPKAYARKQVQGTVIAKYVVDKNGQIKDVRIVKTIGGGFTKAVEDVLKTMPRQVPGTIDGVPADVEVTLPVKFKASEEKVEENPDLPDPTVIISHLGNRQEKPLFILDGKIVEQLDLKKDVDPNDIDRIDVLKGEQAQKEYGERGANGVVRIYTKQRPYDVSPVFPGCEDLEGEEQLKCSKESFLRSVYTNITYPASAREKNIEGMIVVKYTIGKDGKVKDALIHRGIDKALDQEVLRVINDLPDWQPALKDGKPVSTDIILPVRFKIENDEPLSSEAKEALREDTFQESKKSVFEKSPVDGKVVDEIVVTGYGKVPAKREAVRLVDEMPRFPGCEEESAELRNACAQRNMLDFVYKNITYPKAAKEAGTFGTVIASFIVGKDGSIRDVRIVKGRGHGLNEEVVNMIGKMPKWIPGRQDGKAVDAVVNLPVKFKLDLREKKPTTVRVTGPDQLGVDKQQLDLQNFKAAPNPSNGLINLRFQGKAQPLSVRILSANGQVVYQRELPRFSGNFDEQIDLQDAPKGTLFISVQQEEKVYTSTIILQ